MRLTLRRAATARTLLASAAAAATLTTVMLTVFLQYAELLPAASARAALAEAEPVQKVVLFSASGGANAAELTARDEELRRLVARELPGAPVTTGAYASGQRLPDRSGTAAYAVVAFLDALPQHADLVTGAWPTPVPAGQPVQVALPEQVARELAAPVRTRIAVVDELANRPTPVDVVGVFRPRDPAEPYWQLARAPVAAGGYGPMVVHRDEFLRRYTDLSTVDWLAEPRLVGTTNAQLRRLGDAAEYLVEAKPEALGVHQSLRIRTGLDELSAGLAATALVTRSGLLLPVLLFALITGYGLLFVARLLTEHRRAEHALLRARGAGRWQLSGLALREGLLVVLPAALLGAPLAAPLLRLVHRWSVHNGLDLLGSTAPLRPGAWLIAAGAALGCAAALVLPAARHAGTWVDEQQARSRPRRALTALRAGADLALVGVAVLAAAQLRQYAGTLTPVGNALDVDPLLVSAPALGVLAATVASMRLLPLVTRGAVSFAGRRGSFSRLFGLWQADRRPHAGPVLLLVLAVATGTLTVCVAATRQRSERDQAAHRVGADQRVTWTRPETAPDLPAGPHAMAVERSRLRIGDDVTASVLAVDAAAAGDVVRLRPDLSDEPVRALFDRLASARRRTPGVDLPPGATRVTGRIAYTVDGPAFMAGQFRPELVHLHVADKHDTVHEVSLGLVDVGRAEAPFTVPLPAGGTRLLGLSGGVRSFPPFDDQPLTETHLDLVVTGLSTVDAVGASTPIAVPPSWTVTGSTSPRMEWLAPLRVRSTLRPDEFGQAWQFLLGGADPAARADPLPVIVTPHVLAAANASVGDRFSLSGPRTVDVRVVGVLDTLPGTDGGAAVAVDLTTLSTYLFHSQQGSVLPREWWLSGDRGTVQAAGFVTTDVDTEARKQRPLGSGVLLALYAAALIGTVLAAFGLLVDARATALRRAGELAVLYTLGTSPSALARALVVEQSVLAGLGVTAGTAVGVAISTLMGPSLVSTSTGARPVPDPIGTVPAAVALPAVVLFAVALLLGGIAARQARRDVVGRLARVGEL